MNVTVTIYTRTNLVPGDVFTEQADIVGPGFDHHGVGKTPAEALFNASLHWYDNEGITDGRNIA